MSSLDNNNGDFQGRARLRKKGSILPFLSLFQRLWRECQSASEQRWCFFLGGGVFLVT